MSETILEQRLGEPAALAATAADQYRRATWVGRHPLLVFGLLPVPALILVLIGLVVGLELTALGVSQFLPADPADWPRAVLATVMDGLSLTVRLVPFAVLAWVFTRLYTRHHVGRAWFAAAAVQVLFLAGTFTSVVHHDDRPGHSSWAVGFAWLPVPADGGWALPFLGVAYWGQLAQVLVPAAVGGRMLRAARRRPPVPVAG